MSCFSCTDSDNEEKKDSLGFFSQILPNSRGARVVPAPSLPNSRDDRLPPGWNPELEGVVKYQRMNYKNMNGFKPIEPFISKEGQQILTHHLRTAVTKRSSHLPKDVTDHVVSFLDTEPRASNINFLQRILDNEHNVRSQYPYFPFRYIRWPDYDRISREIEKSTDNINKVSPLWRRADMRQHIEAMERHRRRLVGP